MRPLRTATTGAGTAAFRACLLGALLLVTARAAGAGELTAAAQRLLSDSSMGLATGILDRAVAESILRTVDPEALVVPAGGGEDTNRNARVAVEDWPEALRYIRLPGMHAQVAGDPAWKNAGEASTGLIVDLRGAGGDGLAAVDSLASLFGGGTGALYVVRTVAGQAGTGGAVTVSGLAPGPGAPTNRPPVILLVNRRTRGAAELLAAVLSGRRGVMVIGEPTAGDDRIREWLPMTSNTMAYFASRRVEPAGRPSYRGTGVKPDVLVSESAAYAAPWIPADPELEGGHVSDRSRRDIDLMRRVGSDPVLARATDILLGIRALRGGGSVTNTAGVVHR